MTKFGLVDRPKFGATYDEWNSRGFNDEGKSFLQEMGSQEVLQHTAPPANTQPNTIGHMYHEEARLQQPTTQFSAIERDQHPPEDFIMDEEEIDVHLPASLLEEAGVSFRDENKAVENEEEVEAHLPDDDALADNGKTFSEEEHHDIERSGLKWRRLPENAGIHKFLH